MAQFDQQSMAKKAYEVYRTAIHDTCLWSKLSENEQHAWEEVVDIIFKETNNFFIEAHSE